jgi:hypothetical protein
MTIQDVKSCLNCGRTEAQTPLVAWRYQSRELWICPQCMPAFIHETEKVLAKWQASGGHTQSGTANGE